VQTHGSWFHYADEDGELTKLQGVKGLRRFIAEHEEIQEYIHSVAIEANERER
jgi:hypothetical protein